VLRLVLEVNNGGVRISKPHGGPSQMWQFENDGTVRSNLDLVLDICGKNTGAGASVIAYRKHGGWNQLFKTVLISG